MEPVTGRGLIEHFAALEDPRVERTRVHPLLGIVAIAVCAVIAGAESWNDMEEFGQATEDFFADFLDLPEGIPRTTPSIECSKRSTLSSSGSASSGG